MTVSDDAQERAAKKLKQRDLLISLAVAIAVTVGLLGFAFPGANSWAWLATFFICWAVFLAAFTKARATDNQAYRWPGGRNE